MASSPDDRFNNQSGHPPAGKEVSERMSTNEADRPDGHLGELHFGPTETLDIFSVPNDGKPLWVQECAGLQQARKIMHQIAASSPGEYFIFHVHSGTVVERIASNGASPNVDGSFSKDGH